MDGRTMMAYTASIISHSKNWLAFGKFMCNSFNSGTFVTYSGECLFFASSGTCCLYAAVCV